MARLSRFLQPPTERERAVRGLPASPDGGQPVKAGRHRPADLPTRIGPAEFSALGSMVAVRCPSDLAPLMQKAGGLWEPGSRRWLVERRRIAPLIRNLRRATDPLFRRVGIDLDDGEAA